MLLAYVYMYVPVPYVFVCMLLYHYMSMRTVGLEVRSGVAPRSLKHPLKHVAHHVYIFPSEPVWCSDFLQLQPLQLADAGSMHRTLYKYLHFNTSCPG